MNIVKKSLYLQEYLKTLQAMISFTKARTDKTIDEIWCVEHPAVFTQGKHGNPQHIFNLHNIPIFNTDRGGQVTYHGPGQAIIYFLIDVKRNKLGASKLVSIMEQACVNVLKKYYNIRAHTLNNFHGIYVNNKKIASLGLRITLGKTYHGIAINTKMDLTPFSYINPCGRSDVEMCQISDFNNTVSTKKIFEQYHQEFIRLTM